MFFLFTRNSSRDNYYWVEGNTTRMISPYYYGSSSCTQVCIEDGSTDQCFTSAVVFEIANHFTAYDKNFKFSSCCSSIGGLTDCPWIVKRKWTITLGGSYE